MSLERKDVRLKLDAEMHSKLRAICELDDIDIAEFIESVLVPVIERRVRDAIGLSDKLQKLGIIGNGAGKNGRARE